MATALLSLLTGTAIALHHPDAGADPTPVEGPHAGHILPGAVPVAVTTAAPLPRTGWTATADNTAATANNVLDGNPATVWRTTKAALPHYLTIDTHNQIAFSGLTYLAPAGTTGGRIGRYQVQISADGAKWSAAIATGTFADNAGLKTVTVKTLVTRFVRLRALSGAHGHSAVVGAAEINLLGGTDPILPRTGWTAAADSEETTQANGRAANALDGNTNSIWQTSWTTAPELPHTFTIDMRKLNLVSGFSYLPRPSSNADGRLGQYQITTSTDGVNWNESVASGVFLDSAAAQTTTFAPQLARFARLTVLTEAGGRGPWSSAAEFNLLGRPNPSLARTGWTATADSAETASADNRPALVLDGNATTFWHTAWSSDPPAAFPHTLTIDLKKAISIGGMTYLPRPADSANGHLGKYQLATSTNGTMWANQIANGTFADNAALQTVVFPPTSARYLRLRVLTEAAGRGPWSSAAEINVFGPNGSVSPGSGTWGAPVGFPLIPVAAAQLPNGKILTWSSFKADDYVGGTGQTITATYDPATGVVTQRTITDTGHDMFCPGISTLADGRILVTGGNDSRMSSIYDPKTDAWTTGPEMTTPRGYQASATLGDGRVFTIGGSWSGGHGGVAGNPHKSGEVFSLATGWTALPDADVVPMLTDDADPSGDYRKDNHAWLFGWSGGKVLQAGPSRAMNWYTTTGTGGVAPAGIRGDDGDAMNGNAVMYDAGKILTLGGSPSYTDSYATANAYVLTINGTNVTTKRVASLANTRAFVNSVVLPDGQVAVFGGQNYAVPFSDNTSVYNAELWNPATQKFTLMSSSTMPRNYHSVALLMPDGRVFTGGGGLCGPGCATNHFDAQIFTPPYLLNQDGSLAVRPVLSSAPTTVGNGKVITVKTAVPVSAFAIVRMGTATHSVDTDQRRLSLKATAVKGGYHLTIPPDPGVAIPGYWMLFALNAKGVPSIAKLVKIG